MSSYDSYLNVYNNVRLVPIIGLRGHGDDNVQDTIKKGLHSAGEYCNQSSQLGFREVVTLTDEDVTTFYIVVPDQCPYDTAMIKHYILTQSLFMLGTTGLVGA